MDDDYSEDYLRCCFRKELELVDALGDMVRYRFYAAK